MSIWLVKMSETSNPPQDGKTYYVYGSGLIAVPYSRMNDIPRLRLEYHSEEVRKAMMAARTRKFA
jgi:hypothetical protein